MATYALGNFMSGYPAGWNPTIRLAKYIGFSADEPARQCVGFAADSASRYRTSITTSGYTCISTFASKSKQHVGSMVDISTAVSGDDAATQLAEVAFQGLLPHIKEKYASQEFYIISQMANRMTEEARPYEQKRSNFQKKVNFVDCSDSSDSDDDQMVGSAEWIQNNKKPISYPFGNKEPEKYGFDITKADKIFDLLLSEGQIKLKPYNKIPTDQELKNIKYYKWHNATSHDTNECKVFRQQIQSAIEQGRLKFETPKKPMKIDGHPFPANRVDVGKKGNALQTKMLTSQSAKESGAVDPKA
ncbi:uncharacterized protein LOC120689010 [Panicum virgatum]|uniref:uncharacterized protein LOC120689010 n=1 Tax=Panicum virgatum TaxID=38727 RepID=UPI0019D59B14|nr:uncharacterized protein LOC120689010 [Panicum virgatum]